MSVRYPESVRNLLVPIDSVQQHPDNPRNGDIDMIVESIRINGWHGALVVHRPTGYILAGNHRWQALHALGATEVPVLFTDSDMDDIAAMRMLLMDNASSDAAMNDPAALASIIRLLDANDALLGSGHRIEELALLEVPPPPLVPTPPSINGCQVIIDAHDIPHAEEIIETVTNLGLSARMVVM